MNSLPAANYQNLPMTDPGVGLKGKAKLPRFVQEAFRGAPYGEWAIALLWFSRARNGRYDKPSRVAGPSVGLTPAHYRRLVPKVFKRLRRLGLNVKYANGVVEGIPKVTGEGGGFVKAGVPVEALLRVLGRKAAFLYLVLEGQGAGSPRGTQVESPKLIRATGWDHREVRRQLRRLRAAGAVTIVFGDHRIIRLNRTWIRRVNEGFKAGSELYDFDPPRCTISPPQLCDFDPSNGGRDTHQDQQPCEVAEPSQRPTTMIYHVDLPPSDEGGSSPPVTRSPGTPEGAERKKLNLRPPGPVPSEPLLPEDLGSAAARAAALVRPARVSSSTLEDLAQGWVDAGEDPATATPGTILGVYLLAYRGQHGRTLRLRNAQPALAAIRGCLEDEDGDPTALLHVAKGVHDPNGAYFGSMQPEMVFGDHWAKASDAADRASLVSSRRQTGQQLARKIARERNAQNPMKFNDGTGGW